MRQGFNLQETDRPPRERRKEERVSMNASDVLETKENKSVVLVFEVEATQGTVIVCKALDSLVM